MLKIRGLNRIVSLILVIVMCFSMVSSNLYYVYATEGEPTAKERTASFMNFMKYKDEVNLENKNLTKTDYYTMFTFLSNWFEPGKTTLNELLEPTANARVAGAGETSGAVKRFIDIFEFTGGDDDVTSQGKMFNIIKSFGNDFLAAMQMGSCTLINNSGVPITGQEFLATMANGGKVHYMRDGDTKVALDFSAEGVHASMLTLFSVNPGMFMDSNGINSMEAMFMDAVGNIWGIKDKSVFLNYETFKSSRNLALTSEGGTGKEIYLIMPSCLNPAVFTPQAKKQKDLRFPLINRFALSGLVYSSTTNPLSALDAIQKYPNNLSNVISKIEESQGAKSILSIFAVNGISPYTFNYNNTDLDSVWSEENRNLDYKVSIEDLEHNYNSQIRINSDTAESNGTLKSLSYCYLAVDIDFSQIVSLTGDRFFGNGGSDLKVGSIMTSESDYAFGVFYGYSDGTNDTIALQKKLIQYLGETVIVPIDKVSMNLYRTQEGFKINEEIDDDYMSQVTQDALYSLENLNISEQEGALTNQEVAKLGLSGANLFFEDASLKYKDEGFITLNAAQPVKSYLVKTMIEEDLDLAKYLMLNETDKYNIHTFIKKFGLGKYANDTEVETALTSDLNLGWSEKTQMNIKEEVTDGAVPYSSYYLYPIISKNHLAIYGDGSDNIVVAGCLSKKDSKIIDGVAKKDDKSSITIDDFRIAVQENTVRNKILSLYGYTILLPIASIGEIIRDINIVNPPSEMFGTTDTTKNKNLHFSGRNISFENNTNVLAGIYLSYIVDMMGIGTIDSRKSVAFGAFSSPFIPNYGIKAEGTLSVVGVNPDADVSGITGVDKGEDLSFKQKQKDLINRIYGLTNDSNNDYRNSLIKNILDGFFLTIHRTITGTWGDKISSVSTGTTNTYQSVTGYIYTPTLEELSFTSYFLKNYIDIYIISFIILFILVAFLVLMNRRTWQQGLLTMMIMSVALLFPYVLISNTVTISNKVSNQVYSDRFDFWAYTEHFQSLNSLMGVDYMSEKDKWLVTGSATADETKLGKPAVKIKWMAPKKVEVFKGVTSDPAYNEKFATNIAVFKWLFSRVIVDSEYVDSSEGTYLFRPYKNIALEAKDYYAWGKAIYNDSNVINKSSVNIDGKSYNISNALNIIVGPSVGRGDSEIYLDFLGAVAKEDPSYFKNSSSGAIIIPEEETIDDAIKIAQFLEKTKKDDISIDESVALWGLYSSEVSSQCVNEIYDNNLPGIISNLPSGLNKSFSKDSNELAKAIYLKNTESPYYYFYSVLKARFGDNETDKMREFRKALLNKENFKITQKQIDELNYPERYRNTDMPYSYRDFLGLEGLFEYVIPQLKMGNEYVKNWEEENNLTLDSIERYNFKYEVDEEGKVIEESQSEAIKKEPDGGDSYKAAVENKNKLNQIWNMYSPWVDMLYDTTIVNDTAKIAGKNLNIMDAYNPSSYYLMGRPMIFSEADMYVKGYRFKDLTDVEMKIQRVTEETYKDMMYLVNYYDMAGEDKSCEVLISAAAMYATFNFNREFSEHNFIGDSVALYPQGFELRNFNYDAFMRLALLNSTGENVFAKADLYERVLAKTSIITGLLLLVCDVIACVLIPMVKFIILLALLFLGLLISITCVINPPDKIFKTIMDVLVLPSFIFMILNIGFAVIMSLIIGEGLTAYVGSKNINLTTNDPTVTLVLMALCGGLYIFISWKIIKMIYGSYKKYGLSTALAGIGIVTSALTSGIHGIVKKTSGGVVGAVTADSGHRLGGAFEGSRSGPGGVIERNIRDARRARMMNNGNMQGLPYSDKVKQDINNKASGGSDTSSTTSTVGKTTSQTAKAKNQKPEPVIEKDRKFTNDVNKNGTLLERGMGNIAYMQEMAKDKINGVKYRTYDVGTSLLNRRNHVEQSLHQVKKMPERTRAYLKGGLESYKYEKEYHALKREDRNIERNFESAAKRSKVSHEHTKFKESKAEEKVKREKAREAKLKQDEPLKGFLDV